MSNQRDCVSSRCDAARAAGQVIRRIQSPRLRRGDDVLHPDFAEHWPQSGERVRGAANLRAILENYPGGVSFDAQPAYHGQDEEWAITPGYTVVRVTESGNEGTGVIRLRYGDGSEWWMVALFELKDDKVYRQTTFFASPFDAPAWRAQWVERETSQPK